MKFEEAKKLIEELDSGLMSCNMDYEGGFWDAKDRVLEILDEIDTEPVGNPDKLTLTELAKKLREILRFKYLAYGEIFAWGQPLPVVTMSNLPLNLSVRDEGGEGVPCYIHEWECKGQGIMSIFFVEDLANPIDLSEYKDEDGNIDYSRCIVEVE